MAEQSRQLSFLDLPPTASPASESLAFVLERSARRKRSIQISVQPDLTVRVIAPLRLARARIDEMVRARAPWILKRRNDLRLAHGAQAERQWVSGEHLPLLDEELELRIRPQAGKRMLQARRDGDVLEVIVPLNLDGVDAIRRLVHKWYGIQAQSVFLERTAVYAEILGVKPRQVLVRNQESRWGSCAHDGTLRFCWRLVLAPKRVLDYVVVHELSHIQHPHHQRAFWDTVGSVLPNYPDLRAELKRDGARYRL
ncbi:MAG: M48 family metallopeptidase [Chloroflexota bacterium]